MLYGNIVFIKKSGGDGSKYPVTEKKIKIGRSEDCLIRIHNPQVASEHCELIIDDNGQAKLRYLSKVAIQSETKKKHEDAILCHGDVFHIGQRLARWEYLPFSVYYRQPLSPTGRLVAVVMPQQRSLEGNATPGTSSSVTSVSRSMSSGGESRYSERTVSENGSVKKVSRISSVTKNQQPVSNVAKFIYRRHSLQVSKSLFGSKTKQRKSTPGIISSIRPKPEVVGSPIKPTMASWVVNIVSPRSSGRATQRKSTPIKKPLPMKSVDKLMQSGRKSTRTLDLNTIVESPPKEKVKEEVSSRSTRSTSRSPPVKKNVNLKLGRSSLSVTPGKKSISKTERLFNSEKKLTNRSSLKTAKGLKRSSLVLKPLHKTHVKGVVKKLYENISKSTLSHDTFQENERGRRSNAIFERPSTSLTQTPSEGRRISNKSSPTTSSVKNTPTSKSLTKSIKSSKAVISPVVKTPTVSSKEKMTPITRRSLSPRKSSRFSKSPSSKVASSVKKSPSARRSLSETKEKSSPRGVRRKLSPSISSAERAAKKLKTSSPTKPDKNKKAALLVLGKANRKQVLSQNLKVLLKQKIVKKAIKQSIPPTIRKDNVSAKTSVKNVKKKSKRKAVKRKKITTAKKSPAKRKSPPKVSKIIDKSEAQKPSTPLLSSSSKNETPKEGKNVSPRKSTSASSVIEKSPSKNKVLNTDSSFSSKSPSKQGKKLESSTTSFSLSEQSASKSIRNFNNSFSLPSNYLFNSHRRSSKRLSSMNDFVRPDFTELSPTALGLIPKNAEIFKSPKEGKRRSISLATPKNFQTAEIVKSASTSKVGNRKMVRFSSTDSSFGSGLLTPNTTKEIDFDFDFESIQTPNITMDRFVSPLVTESFESFSENEMSGKVSTFPGGELQRKKLASTNNMKSPRSEPKRKASLKCSRKLLQSPQPKNVLSRAALFRQDSEENTKTQRTPKKELTDTTGVQKLLETSQTQKTVKGIPTRQARQTSALRSLTRREGKSVTEDSSIIEDVRKLFVMSKAQKSPKNDLSDVKGVARILRTPKVVKSPKNDLTDVRGVKKLLKTPKVQKSPKNDLTDVRGVKKLLRTPKVQKSPKNDLSDVRGVKKLLKTPKVQKSPKNDLTDVRGVKKLLRTPKVQKSPKNDLSDVRGVKKLLKTPKVQKSPKNDLSDVRGVRNLVKTPRAMKSPKNDLTDVAGVKRLLRTPQIQKSPENNLTDFQGVRQLVKSPRTMRSPKNELTDLRGVLQLLSSPKAQKSPKNDLSDLTEVRRPMTTPRAQKNSQNDSMNVSSIGHISLSPLRQRTYMNEVGAVEEIVKKSSERSFRSSFLYGSEVKQVLVVDNVSDLGEESNRSTSIYPKSRIRSFKSIRGRRTIHSSPKSPRNDLSDVEGVKELFSLYQYTSGANQGRYDLSESFDILNSEIEALKRQGVGERSREILKKEVEERVVKTPKPVTRRTAKEAAKLIEETIPRAPRTRRGVDVEKKSERVVASTRAKGGKSLKRKSVNVMETSTPKKKAPSVEVSPVVVKNQRSARSRKVKPKDIVQPSEEEPVTKKTRSNKTSRATSVASPPKLRKRMAATETVRKGSSKKTTTKRMVTFETMSPKEITTEVSVVKSGVSANEKGKKTTSKAATSKVQTRTTRAVSKTSSSKVQRERSQIKSIKKKQTESLHKISPRNTRSTSARRMKTQK